MNISEFAEIAGVSKAAVSRYFNDGYLSEDKRLRIEKALKETGYSPSVAARSVKTRITKLVGVILPKLSSESCARVTEGISEVLNAEGYQLLLVNTANNNSKEVESLDLFRQNRVDGVILLGTVFTPLHLSVLSKMHVPVVIVGQRLAGFNCVCHNDLGAAYALTKLMLEKGRKKPAFIGVTRDDLAAGLARWEGFEKAVAEAGLSVPKNFIETAKFEMDSGYEKAKRMLSGRELPDCIFCATDSIALGVMLCCKEKGIDVPKDIMLASVGDTKIGKAAFVPLTTAHLHYKTAGIDAAEMLLIELRRRDAVNRVLQLDYEIIERGTTSECETV
ncbi:MAG: LacI family DNA-binding transcriptional regulator [Ruminococcus sp.]|nr:LacI family DNA-binding transcriptional regulator [Ruminococcus sp.]MBR1751636.1 LacI family DNA-binding transcriptional regulator [Ruminococcus sp.]MBR1752983.1 LacI family DNA-binding transcriptional regulator [Ruminococcus sp.]